MTPHVTRNDKTRSSNLDRRTTRQPGYAVSLGRRWLIERGFGWLVASKPAQCGRSSYEDQRKWTH